MKCLLPIDSQLLEKAFKLGKERTRTAVVHRALEEFIAQRDPARIIELFGTLDWDPTTTIGGTARETRN